MSVLLPVFVNHFESATGGGGTNLRAFLSQIYRLNVNEQFINSPKRCVARGKDGVPAIIQTENVMSAVKWAAYEGLEVHLERFSLIAFFPTP